MYVPVATGLTQRAVLVTSVREQYEPDIIQVGLGMLAVPSSAEEPSQVQVVIVGSGTYTGPPRIGDLVNDAFELPEPGIVRVFIDRIPPGTAGHEAAQYAVCESTTTPTSTTTTTQTTTRTETETSSPTTTHTSTYRPSEFDLRELPPDSPPEDHCYDSTIVTTAEQLDALQYAEARKHSNAHQAISAAIRRLNKAFGTEIEISEGSGSRDANSAKLKAVLSTFPALGTVTTVQAVGNSTPPHQYQSLSVEVLCRTPG